MPIYFFFFLIVMLSSIGLPLLNGFVGEFLMFNGVFSSAATKYSTLFTVTAAISIILSAVYMLNMIQRVFYGPTNAITAGAKDVRMNEKIILALIVLLIVISGVYPKPFFDLTRDTVESILTKMNYKL